MKNTTTTENTTTVNNVITKDNIKIELNNNEFLPFKSLTYKVFLEEKSIIFNEPIGIIFLDLSNRWVLSNEGNYIDAPQFKRFDLDLLLRNILVNSFKEAKNINTPISKLKKLSKSRIATISNQAKLTLSEINSIISYFENFESNK